MNTIYLLFSLTATILLATSLNSSAQTTGTVEYKYLGIRFTIPDGWIGQENEIGYIVGSYTEPGFALLTTNPSRTVEELRQQAQQGIYEENGTMLSLTSSVESLGSDKIGGEFQGTLEGQAVRAYIVGMVNPHGDGVTVMAIAAPQEYSSIHRTLATNLVNSMQFYEAETPPVVEEWRQALQNAKLTYMDSYHTQGGGVNIDGTVYGTGGGYISKVEIHLCGQGYFKYNSGSSVNVDHGAFGGTNSASQGSGTWSVIGNAQGGATLRLQFHNGDMREYTLDYQNNQTMLNGKRYYRTYASEGAEFGPDCR